MKTLLDTVAVLHVYSYQSNNEPPRPSVSAYSHLRETLGVSRLMVGIVCRTCSTIQLSEALTLRPLKITPPPPHDGVCWGASFVTDCKL